MNGFFQIANEKHNITGLSVALVNGDQNWTHGFDWADKTKRQFVMDNTAFRLGSTTKLFTATMLMQLVEQKVVCLDDLVTEYLPHFSLNFRGEPQDITLYDLATHTSGLPNMMPLPYLADPVSMIQADIEGIGKYPTVDELTNYAWEAEFRHKARSEYSNMGFAILGAALASAVKHPYRKWISLNILEALGMQNSGFTYANLSPRATGYLGKSMIDVIGNIEEAAPTPDIGAFAPAGQLAGSACDLLLFMRAFMSSNALISADTVETMTTACVLQDGTITRQAIGWGIEFIAGERAITHVGFDYGFSSCLLIIPNRRIGIACLCNDGMNPAIEKLTFDAAREVLNS